MNSAIDDLFAKLAHDLKNDFIIIRAAAGSIKKNSDMPEIIDKKVELINHTLNQAIDKLEKTKTLLRNG